MNIVKPTFEILDQFADTNNSLLNNMYKHIEYCGRTCYKSNDKITDDSGKPFVDRMISNNHLAMLEHGTVYLYLEENSYNWFEEKKYVNSDEYDKWIVIIGNIYDRYKENKYSRVINVYYNGARRVYITTNLRVIIENHWEDDLEYICQPMEEHIRRYTVKYTHDIHFYKDITRHRVFSYAIESTRFCNYIKEKFGHSVTFAMPCWLKDEEREEFENDLQTIESIYFKWINRGWQPQQAAYFLCQGTKAEIIMTGFVDDWRHFFDLRAIGTTGAPHPSVKELALPLMNEFIERGYLK